VPPVLRLLDEAVLLAGSVPMDVAGHRAWRSITALYLTNAGQRSDLTRLK
jgi:hypothetical protein